MIDAVLEAAPRALELERILAQGLVRSVYQPIVDLDTGEVVAYEALARGPEGSPLERPDRLFAAAREAGRVSELDWACRAAALRGALDAGLKTSLFVNVEPSLLDAPAPEDVVALLARAGDELDVVLELTERSLTDRPAEMLARVGRMRELFQESRHFTPRSAARYEALASHAAFVGALGVGLASEPARAVRGATLDAADPVHGEWNVVVVAPHFAAAFVARDLGDPADDDMGRRFEFCLTYDRGLPVDAARALLTRIAPVSGG